MSIKYFLFWLPMIGIAFFNASLRELIIVRQFTALRAHQLSTITLMLMCSVYIYLIFPYLKIDSGSEALLVGLEWVLLTTLFELILGRLTNKSWPELLHQYNVVSGQIWPVFLVALLFLPYLCWLVAADR
jgi:hypothetical protein